MASARSAIFTLIVTAIIMAIPAVTTVMAQENEQTAPTKTYIAGDKIDLKGPTPEQAGIPEGWQADYTWTIEQITKEGRYIDVTAESGVSDPKTKDISGHAFWPKGMSDESVNFRVTLSIFPKTASNSLGSCIASSYFFYQVKKPDCTKIEIKESEVCETDKSQLSYTGNVNGLTLTWYLNPGNKPGEGEAVGQDGTYIGEGASLETTEWMKYDGYRNGKNIVRLKANEGVVCSKEFTIAKVPKPSISV